MLVVYCFGPGCAQAASADDDAVCDRCRLARFCSDACRAQHLACDECAQCADGAVHRSVAAALERVRRDGLRAVVEQALGSLNDGRPGGESTATYGCWTVAMMIARVVGGYEALEVLASQRVTMEAMLLGQQWTQEARRTLQEQCTQRAKAIVDVAQPISLVAWFMPAENYMYKAPHRSDVSSYDHAFVVVPIDGGGAGGGGGARGGADDDGASQRPCRAMLLQAVDGERLQVSLVDQRVFWTGVQALVEARVWTNAVAACYRQTFGIEHDFAGRTITAAFDVAPLVPAVCAHCATPTAPSHCSRCQRAVYCNVQCQQAHWPKHRRECKRPDAPAAAAVATATATAGAT